MDELFLSTDMVDPDMRTEAWRETTRLFFDTTHRPGREDQPLEGSLCSRLVGGMLIGPTSFNDQQYRRDRRTIVASGLDQFLIQLFVEGSLEGDCAGTAIRVERGDICVFDLAQPLTTQVSRGSTISVILPRDAVDRLSGGRNLHGTVLSADDPSTRLVADVIRSVSGLAAGRAGDHRFTAMAEPVAGLIISGLIQGGAAHLEQGSSHTVLLRRRMLDFVELHLTSPEIGPIVLMKQFNISRAHLYRMFASEGGVARIIRERRLDRSYRDLMGSAVAQRSISDLAYLYGFASSRQFHRSFRARFGVSPSDVAQEGVAPIMSDQRLAEIHAQFALYAGQMEALKQRETVSASAPERARARERRAPVPEGSEHE